MSGNKYNIKAKSHILSLLGDELIGSDSLAIFELVKNAYDADATKVNIIFENLNQENQKIIIEDNGSGMSLKILQDVWLTIGTDFKRGKNKKESSRYKRISFGEKGVGRLAVHKLAKKITLETKTKDEIFTNKICIDWPSLISSKEYIQDLQVEIDTVSEEVFIEGHGTKITLEHLTTKKWSKKVLKDLVRKINNIKNPFILNPDFNVSVRANDFHDAWIKEVKDSIDILQDSLYQFQFKIYDNYTNNDFVKFEYSYVFNPPTQTKIEKIEEKTILDKFLIGDIFKDLSDYDKDSLYLKNKDLLGIGSFEGKFYVFNQNSNLLKMDFGSQITAIKDFIKDNCGVKIFRDNIRVYNYGEPFDDWLGLDLDKIQRAGDHFGKKVTIGAIELQLKESNELTEKTNREGFIENETFSKFRLICKVIFNLFERVSAPHKDQIEEFLEGTRPIKKIGFGDTINELEKKIIEKNLEKELSTLINRINKDYTEMRDIMINSGLTGLNLGIAFHEVEREVQIINQEISQNINQINIESIKNKITNLVQILEGLSPILRQNKSILTSAKYLVARSKEINSNRFQFHNIIFSSPLLSGESPDIKIKVPTNLLISVISNIIDNSIYWTRAKADIKHSNNEKYQPAIYIGTDLDTFEGPAIIIADNGDGFSKEPEYMAQAFKTTKEGGMGLGLYFADMVMNMIGGKLLFPDNLDLDIPKIYDGACLALVFPK